MSSTEASLGVFGAGPVVISEQCINRLHRDVGCTRCADACPVGSINLDTGVPVVDSAMCVGCGACIPVCPAESIGTSSPRRPLALAIEDAPPGPVILACPRGGSDTATKPIIRHECCLAALGADELLDLTGDPPRELWLDDSPCEGCDIRAEHVVIANTVRGANDLHRAFGLTPLIHRTTDDEQERGPFGDSGPVLIAGPGGAMSRRGLFRRMSDVVTRCIAADEVRGPPPRRERLLRHLRTTRAGHEAEGVSPVDIDVGFGDVDVDGDRCSACGLCAQFCPADALVFETAPGTGSGATFALSFRPANCVACNLCVVACPEQAVGVKRAVQPAMILDDTTRTVAAGPVVRCEICRQTTTTARDGRNRCFSCRDGVVTPVRDEAGLMLDLIARTGSIQDVDPEPPTARTSGRPPPPSRLEVADPGSGATSSSGTA